MLPTKFRFIWLSGFRGEDLNKMNCELMLTYDTPALRQTGSRNLMGPKTKYQISAINSC